MNHRRLAAISVVAASLLGACSSALNQLSGPTTTAAAKSAAPGGVPSFAPLNQAIGFGLLRLMTLEERPNPRDVVIYQALPNELPRVAGVITTVGQTPLSHVNLRAVQDKVPNAVAGTLLDDPTISGLIGRYVKYTVTESGYTMQPATLADVEAHHAATRPTQAQVPERDLSIKTITPLSRVRSRTGQGLVSKRQMSPRYEPSTSTMFLYPMAMRCRSTTTTSS